MRSFVFSLDGALTKTLVIPFIASHLGVEREILKLRELHLQSEMPFQQAFILTIGVLARFDSNAIREIIRGVPLHAHLVDFIRSNADACTVVTDYPASWVEALRDRFRVNLVASPTAMDPGSSLDIGRLLDKAGALHRLNGPVTAVGGGVGDAEMIAEADIGIAFAAVHQPAVSVMEVADYAIFTEDSLCRFLRRL
jgi:phosphoserine phosphatase